MLIEQERRGGEKTEYKSGQIDREGTARPEHRRREGRARK